MTRLDGNYHESVEPTLQPVEELNRIVQEINDVLEQAELISSPMHDRKPLVPLPTIRVETSGSSHLGNGYDGLISTGTTPTNISWQTAATIAIEGVGKQVIPNAAIHELASMPGSGNFIHKRSHKNALKIAALLSSGSGLINALSATPAAASEVRNTTSTHIHHPQSTLEIKRVVLEKGDTIVGLAEPIARQTGLPLKDVVEEMERLNAALIKRDGGVRRLHIGQELEEPVVPKAIPPTKEIEPRTQISGTETIVLKKGDEIYPFAVDYARRTGISVSKAVALFEKINAALIKRDGGVRRLHIGQELEEPVVPKVVTSTHPIQHHEHTTLTSREKAIANFKKPISSEHGKAWAAGPEAPLNVGDIILYRDIKTGTYDVATVAKLIGGRGTEREVITNKGEVSMNHIIEIGELPAKAITSDTPIEVINIDSIGIHTQLGPNSLPHLNTEQPAAELPMTPPSSVPKPSDTPILGINSNHDGDQSTAGSVAPHDKSTDPHSNNGNGQSKPAPKPTPHPSQAQINTSKDTVVQIIDYSSSHPNEKKVEEAGIAGVFRYYGHPGEGKKLLTKDEIERDHAAGLAIGIVYEAGARDALGGYEAGVRAGKEALAQALKLGQPIDVPIFFPADSNFTQKQLPIVTDFIRGARDSIGEYKAGIYGGFEVVKYVLDSGVVTWAWQTYAWSHGQWDKRAQFRQVKNHVIIAGGVVDRDKGMHGTVGMWLPPNHPSQHTTTSGTHTPTKTPPSSHNSSAQPSHIPSHNRPSHNASRNSGPEARSTDTNVQIYNFFINNGFTHIAAAGIVGNTNAESGSQPERLEGTPSGKETSIYSLTPKQLNRLGFGIAQWTPGKKLLDYAKAHNLDPNALTTQLNFMLATMPPSLKQKLNAEPSAGAAAKLFEREYERPASLRDAGHRALAAQKIYGKMNPASSK